MYSIETLMDMIFTEAADGPAPKCMDKMTTAELRDMQRRSAETYSRLPLAKSAKPRVLKARVLLDDESGGMRMRFV